MANTAAPGVLQATITGFLSTSEGSAEHSPMPRPSAHIHELICSGVAPSAVAAWNTIATEPGEAHQHGATKPRRTAGSDTSKKSSNLGLGAEFDGCGWPAG